ncbi:MAG: GerAB/ArcD/ProY family transporter [Oscillospiraceae bacterium]
MPARNDIISRRQYTATVFVAILSQLIRVVPRALAADAGRAAWVVPLAAAPLVWLYLLFARSLLRKKEEGYSLCSLFEDALGRFFGRLAVFVISLWLVFYSGFLLRNIAERFTSTVYPYSGTGYFIVTMGLLCLLAGMGSFRAIARCAMIFRPILLAIIVLTQAVCLFSVDWNCLLPVTAADAVPVAKSTLRILNLLGPVVYLGFLEDRTHGSVRVRDYLPWMGVLLAVCVCVCVTCVGMYGAGLTARATLPVFLQARDLTVFGSVERVEALITTTWVLTDFVLIATVLFIASKNLRWCFGAQGEGKRFWDLSHGRWLIPLCAVAAVAAGMSLGKNIVSMDALAETIVPGINLLVILILMPLVFVIGRLRKKI